VFLLLNINKLMINKDYLSETLRGDHCIDEQRSNLESC